MVKRIRHSGSGVIVSTEDGSTYNADYVIVSVSLGVLQSKLIKFEPDLPVSTCERNYKEIKNHLKTLMSYFFTLNLFNITFSMETAMEAPGNLPV